MATLIPSLNSCLGRMQAGEKRFARRLEGHLEDDYLCWYEMPVGRRPRHSDFILLHPARGLLLLEVKDWKIDTVRRVDRMSVELLTSSGLVTVGNPIDQVRQCAYLLVDRLKRDPQLVVSSGRYQGQLLFPYGYGVVLTNITRQQFERAGLGEVMPEHQVICSDEMAESVDAEAFQARLWNMFNVAFEQRMSLPQIDRVRWHVFPEIRIGNTGQDMFTATPAEGGDGSAPVLAELVPDILKVMDTQQELLARSLGNGHRVIHGVAGSGKTLILGYRCLYLAEIVAKPILVVCFNITLAARLRSMMKERGVDDRVNVYHFHDWCGEQLKRYHVARPAPGPNYFEGLASAVIAAVDAGHIPRAQYGALMIDEGHDFEADWLRLVVQMVDPDEGSLLLLYDDAQSIYTRRGGINFSLSSVGVQARGRTTILRLNYRNTNEILEFALAFARQYLAPSDSDEDNIPLVEPTAAGRHGPPPHLRICASEDEEFRLAAATLMRLRERGLHWREACVTCHSKALAERVVEYLVGRDIPVTRLVEPGEKRAFDPLVDTVKVMTMHSSKGLEFPLVIIPGIDALPRKQGDAAADAKLLYVAMTRSTDKLLVTASGRSEFVERLDQFRHAAAAQAQDGAGLQPQE
jgi:hypothetical protein